MVARIRYPARKDAEEREGYLIYMRASFTGDENCELTQYRRSNPDFPHDPVIDQFYNEHKFEAYRRLGYHVGLGTCQDIFSDAKITVNVPVLSNWTPKYLSREEWNSQTADCQKLLEELAGKPDANGVLETVHELTACPLDGHALHQLFSILTQKL